MRKLSLFAALLTFTMLVGCSSNNGGNSQASHTNEPSPTGEAATATVQPTEGPTPEPTEEPEKELSNDEQVALNYINIYINGSDTDEKKKFVEENVREDVRGIFLMGAGMESDEEDKLQNPKVKDHTSYDASGMDGSLTWISSDNNIELIILVMEGEVGFAYRSNASDEDARQAFEDMTKNF